MLRALLLLAVACAALPGPAQPKPLDARQTRLIDLALHPYDQPDTPGVAVEVVRGGTAVYRRAVGMADLERGVPLTPEHVFFMASVSKQFTAMCVLLLEEQGKLKLDDDVRKVIPELPEYGDIITIRNLLSHTSGIHDYYSLNELRGIDIESFYTDAEILALICRQKELNFKPGEKYTYSNSGYFLLKTIVERVAKQPLQAFAKAQIFEPLGMTHSRYQEGVDMLVSGRALAYGGTVERGFKNAHNSDAVVGARGLLTTLDDVALWLGNFGHNKLGKGRPELIARLTTPVPYTDGTAATYACGIIARDVRGVKRLAHTGFFAGYRTRVNLYPDADTMILVFANSYEINPDTLSDRIEEIVLGGAMAKPKPVEKPRAAVRVPFDPAASAGMTGLYLDDENNLIEVVVGDDGLLVVSGGSVLRRLDAEGVDQFWDASSGDEVRFVTTGGRAVGIEVKPKDGKVRKFVRQPRVAYDKAALERFVGTFGCAEVEGVHRIAFDGEALVLTVRDKKNPMTALPNGDFTCPLGRIAFAPDAKSYVVHGSRIKRMPFVRR